MKLHVTMAAALLSAAYFFPISASAQAGPEAQPEIIVTAEHQRDWNRGRQIETGGLADLADAEQKLARYNAERADAQTMRDAAQARVDTARSGFEALVAQASSVTDPDRARDLGRDIRKYADDWENFDDQLRSADSNLERAAHTQSDAQEDRDKAQAVVDRGRAMMAEAERRSANNS